MENIALDIRKKAAQYVLELFNKQDTTRLLFHNYQHTVEIVQLINDIAGVSDSNYDEEVKEIAQIAGWFYNVGYLKDYRNQRERSIEMLRKFLQFHKYPATNIFRAESCLKLVKTDIEPSKAEQKLLIDAVHAYEATTNFAQLNPLEKLEWELLRKTNITRLEWEQLQQQSLFKRKFYTPYAKMTFEPIIAKNILAQEKVVANLLKKKENRIAESGGLRKYEGIERKLPERATQTYFRTNYRNHINLSAIADNKANIMLGINAIMMSVVITIISYGNIAFDRPMIVMPVVIFMITGLTSMIFSVLAARPKITSLNSKETPSEEAKKNIIYFGNFVNLELETYEEAVDAMLRDSELMYGNMTRDLYYLGKVLDKKYRLLTVSYNIFMIGFIATVLTFMLAMLI